MKHAALIAYLEGAANELTDRVLAEMYRDPFWHARFGDRADRHGRQDGLFHIKYLVSALAADDRNVMVEYARWLRTLLASHGMCTRHLDDNFALLASEIGRGGGPPERDEAMTLLSAARDALRYPLGPAQRVQDLTPEIRERVASALAAPDWPVEQCADQLSTLLSYLADAIALDNPAQFRAHVTWTGDFLEQRGIARAWLAAGLAALRKELAAELRPEQLAALFD